MNEANSLWININKVLNESLNSINKKIQNYKDRDNFINLKTEEWNKISNEIQSLISRKDKIEALLQKLEKVNFFRDENQLNKKLSEFIEKLDKSKSKQKYKDFISEKNSPNGIHQFENGDDLKNFLQNKLNTIVNNIYIKKDTINQIKESINDIKKKKTQSLEELEDSKIESYRNVLSKDYKCSFSPKDNFIDLLDDLLKLDPNNFSKTLINIFGRLDFKFINQPNYNIFSYFLVNQQEQILKYCEKYKITNEMIYWRNNLTTFVYYSNLNFKGISDIHGTFHICQLKKNNVHKFFLNYVLKKGYFYIKYNLNTNIVKFEYIPKNNNISELLNIEKLGVKMYKNGIRKYDVYVKDDKFIYTFPIDFKTYLLNVSRMKLRYRKKYKNDNKVYDSNDIIKYLSFYTLCSLKSINDYNMSKDIGEVFKFIKIYFDLDEEYKQRWKNIYLNTENPNFNKDLQNLSNIVGLTNFLFSCGESDRYKCHFILFNYGNNSNRCDERYDDFLDEYGFFLEINKKNLIPFIINITKGKKTYLSYGLDNEDFGFYNNYFDFKYKEEKKFPIIKNKKSLQIVTYDKLFKFTINNCFLPHSPFLRIFGLDFSNENKNKNKNKLDIITKYIFGLINKVISPTDSKKRQEQKVQIFKNYGQFKYKYNRTNYVLINNPYLEEDFFQFFDKNYFPYVKELIINSLIEKTNDFGYYFDIELFNSFFPPYIEYLFNLMNIDIVKKEKPLEAFFNSFTGNKINSTFKDIIGNLSKTLNSNKNIGISFNNYVRLRKAQINKNNQNNQNNNKDIIENNIKLDNNVKNTINEKNKFFEEKISCKDKEEIKNNELKIQKWKEKNEKLRNDKNENNKKEEKNVKNQTKNYIINIKLNKDISLFKEIKISEDFDNYYEQPRKIQITEYIKNLRINEDDICLKALFSDYTTGSKELYRNIEQGLFELLYLKDLKNKNSFRIEPMKGHENLYHMYFGSKCRIYFYLENKNVTLLNKIGHTKYKK